MPQYDSFAGGLARGLDAGIRQRLLREETRAKKIARERAAIDLEEIETARDALGQLPDAQGNVNQEAFTDEQARGVTGIGNDFVGPPRPIEAGEAINNVMSRVGSLVDPELRASGMSAAAGAVSRIVQPDLEAAIIGVNSGNGQVAIDALNRAAQKVGKPQLFSGLKLNDSGELIDSDGRKLTVGHIAGLHELLRSNPTAAMGLLSEAGAASREADLAERKYQTDAERVRASIDQGWSELSQRWTALRFEGQAQQLDREKYESDYQLALRELDIDEKLADANVGYLASRAAAYDAEAKAYSDSASMAWNKASDLTTAVDKQSERIDAAEHSMYTDEYATQFVTNDGQGPRSGEEVRGMVRDLANDALIAHGPGAQASSEEGARAVVANMLGDPRAPAITDYDINDDGRAIIVVGGKTLPVSMNAVQMLADKDAAQFQAEEEGALGLFRESPSGRTGRGAIGIDFGTRERSDPSKIKFGEGWRQLMNFREKLLQKQRDFYGERAVPR